MTSTRPGRPIWADLMTPDVDGAAGFYGDLFGWTFEDQGPDFGHYTLALVDGAPVAGLMSSLRAPSGQAPGPVGPAAWTVYLHSADLDTTLAAVPAHGGRIEYGPMDVADQGRQAAVVDPAGAHLGLWQPGAMPGHDRAPWRVGTPGTPVWFETLSTDFDAALPFYRDALGWDVATMPGAEDGGFRYVTNGAGDDAVAGLCDASAWLAPGAPSFWRAYLAVPDADTAAARILTLGGEVQEGPQESPFGRFAQVADPYGAVFMINAA